MKVLKLLQGLAVSVVTVVIMTACQHTTDCAGGNCDGTTPGINQPPLATQQNFGNTPSNTSTTSSSNVITHRNTAEHYTQPSGGGSNVGVYNDANGQVKPVNIEHSSTTGSISREGNNLVLTMDGPNISTFGLIARQADSQPVLWVYYSPNTQFISGQWVSDRKIVFQDAFAAYNQGANVYFNINRNGVMSYENWLDLHGNKIRGDGRAIIGVDPKGEGKLMIVLDP